MKHRQSGFTLPELIIVIAVIGILGGIVSVVWSGVLTGSRDKARETDVKQWSSTFDLYKSRFGAWPIIPSSDSDVVRLCLGQANFQKDSGGFCAQYTNSSKRLAATDSATLMTEVKKMGTEPANGGPKTKNIAAGPFVYMTQVTTGTGPATTVTVQTWIVGFFEGNCPKGIDSTLPTATTFTNLTGGLPSGVRACGVQKTFSYQPNA